MLLNPETANSRPMITIAIQPGRRRISTSDTKAAEIDAFIGNWIEQRSDGRDLPPASRKIAVEQVRQCAGKKNRQGKKIAGDQQLAVYRETKSALDQCPDQPRD